MSRVAVRYVYVESLDPERLQSQLPILSDEEIDCYHRFRFPKHRHAYLAAHVLVRKALAPFLEIEPQAIEFGRENLGKPFVQGTFATDMSQFSLSHTRGLAICAISNRRVGIDAEPMDRASKSNLLESILSAREAAEFEAHTQGNPAAIANRFLQCWTLKEAYIKATGHGLSAPLKEIDFHISETDAIMLRNPIRDEASTWEFQFLKSFPHHRVAIAVKRHDLENITIDLREQGVAV